MSFWKNLTRWHTHRCEECGQKFRWKEDRCSNGGRDGKVFHSGCLSYRIWRASAEETLEILDVTLRLGKVYPSDVEGLLSLTAANENERVANSNKCFRIFRSLNALREENREIS